MVRYQSKTCMGCRGTGSTLYRGEQTTCTLCQGSGQIQERISEPAPTENGKEDE